MYEQVEKPKENKSKAVANSVTQKISNGKQGVEFVDNRPESITQRKIKSQASDSSSLPIQKKENNTGLPDNLKSGIENLSGYSMDDVKVHYNSDKPAQLQAHAYAQGVNIHLGSGQEKHLPHEAWHVVQQKQGRVKPTMQMKVSINVNDDKGLEKEADLMGAKAKNWNSSQNLSYTKFSNSILKNIKQYVRSQDATEEQKIELSASAKTGFEVELRGFYVTHPLGVGFLGWSDNAVYKVTTGGNDGFFVLDQITTDINEEEAYQKAQSKVETEGTVPKPLKRVAIIEWVTNARYREESKDFKDEATKKEEMRNKVNGTKSFAEFITDVSEIVDVGKATGQGLISTFSTNKKTDHVQVNIDVPFENIGVIDDPSVDVAKLFDGEKSKESKLSFQESRVKANELSKKILADYNKTVDVKADAKDVVGINSILTIFYHTIVSKSLEAGKDPHGVLFKSGVGDLVRTALDENGKKILWTYFNNFGKDTCIADMKLAASHVFDRAYPTKKTLIVRKNKLNEIVEEQIKKAFMRGGKLVSLAGDRDLQKRRYGDENSGYGENVLEEYGPTEHRHLGLSGVATGKYFPVIKHKSKDGSVSAKYIVLETRRGDNKYSTLTDKISEDPIVNVDDIELLDKGKKENSVATKEKRQQIIDELSAIQKPKNVYKEEQLVEGKKSKKCDCCFLTTACVAYKGLSDDCEELNILRKFRDTYLLNRSNGKELIEHYYQYSPLIVEGIQENENGNEILDEIYVIVRKCVSAIKRGDNVSAFNWYYEMVVDLTQKITPIEYNKIPNIM